MHLSFSDFAVPRILNSLYRTTIPYTLLLRERLEGIRDQHEILWSPTPEDLEEFLQKRLLSPDFIEHFWDSYICKTGRESRSVLTDRLLIQGIPKRLEALEGHIRSLVPGVTLSEHFTDFTRLWNPMANIFSRCLGETAEIFGLPAPIHLSSSTWVDALHRPEVLWANCERILPDGYLDGIVSSAPDVIFLFDSHPERLHVSIMLASILKPRLPKTRLLLWQDQPNLYSFLANHIDGLLNEPRLFRLFDGISVFTTVADLTYCEVVNRMSAGRTFEGVENLAFEHQGKIHFTPPSERLTQEYMGEATMCRNPITRTNRLTSSGMSLFQNSVPVGIITPTKQKCYWNRCTFCHTSNQTCIPYDPFLSRRVEETVAALIELETTGAAFTFVGFDAVPPFVLRGITETLSALSAPPKWGFEGRLDPCLSDTGFITQLAKAGCVGAIFGLEVASDRLNLMYNKYTPIMNLETIEQITASFECEGMMVHVNTISDLPAMTAGESRHHEAWIQRMFDSRRFFHFNTNQFTVMCGSEVSKDPGAYGIELLPSNKREDIFSMQIPFRYLDCSHPENTTAQIWERIFRATDFRGVNIQELHTICHEDLTFTFLDTLRGVNFFKTIKLRIQDFIQNAQEGVVIMPESVVLAEAEVLGIGDVWLIDPIGSGKWGRIPAGHWPVIHTSIEKGVTISQALEEGVTRDGFLPPMDQVCETLIDLFEKGLVDIKMNARKCRPSLYRDSGES